MYKAKEELKVRFQRLRPIAEEHGYEVTAESSGPCGSTQFKLRNLGASTPTPHHFDSISSVYTYLGIEEEEK